jgi:hypothetical protein
MRECVAYDLFAFSSRTIDADGFLIAPGVIAKAGNVQEYHARELGLDGDPTRLIRLYRPREEVAKSASTFEGKPLTNNHPPGKWVTADNWRSYSVGDVSGVAMQGDDMCATLKVRDRAAIDAVMNGKAGLSNGYRFTFDEDKTTTPEGAAVDGWMTNIQGNHIAIVDRGRGGPGCVIADQERKKTMATRTEKIGKLSFELDATAADAVAAEREEKEKLAADADTAMKLARDTEQRAVAAEAANAEHLKKIEALDAEVKQLKENPPEPSQELVEKLAEERAAVIGDAAILAPELKTSGKPVDKIRREALTACSAGDERIKHIVDAALTGTDVEKASSDVVKSIFAAAVGVAKTRTTGDGLAADMLRAGHRQTSAADSSNATDGKPVGYAEYCLKLTTPRKAQA